MLRAFHDERLTSCWVSCVVVCLTSSGVIPATAFAAGELRATAALAVANDPSGQKAAATAHALLRQKVRATTGLRLLEPAEVLSGDPKTRQEETLERARAALADGRRAYDALALDDAIARLGQSVSLYQKAGPLLGDLDELSTAFTYLGAALVLRGSADEGESTFAELLTINPNHQLEDFPPTVTRIFNRALRRIDRAAAGGVEIYSTPPYASVFIDGRFEGVTPLVLDDLLAGTHYLRLEKLGYEVHGAPLEVAPNQSITNQTRLRDVRRGVVFRDLAARSAAEVDRAGMGGALRRLSRTLVSDVMIVVAATQSGQDATFRAGVFDGATGDRIATRRIVLAADRSTFRRDLGRFLDGLVAVAAKQAPPDEEPVDAARPDRQRRNETEGAFGLGRTEDRRKNAPDSRGTVGAPARRERQTPTGTYVGWSLVGTGAAALITGGVFGALALSKHSDFNDTPQNSPDLPDIQDDGKQNALIADVLYGVGGAMLAGGIATLLWIEFSDPSPSEVFEVEQAGLTPTEGGAFLTVGGRF